MKNGHTQNLADLGYGISQLIPILLKIAIKISKNSPNYEYGGPYYYESSIMIIEEPETNLHPALQSKLADLFIECYKKYNIQFIIETHSEYLIRKLQYLVSKKEIHPTSTQIYYFNHPDRIPEGDQQIKKIDIFEDGSLSNDFGTGFFDEADKIAISLFNMQQSQKN